jgi:hypothetical protein
MFWSDDIDEQKRRQWHAKIARKRLDLSTSVEETLADNSLQEDEWLDEEGESHSSKHISLVNAQTGTDNKKNTALVPPRLSLQSKSLPAVQSDTPMSLSESSSLPATPATPATLAMRSEPKLAGRSTKVRLKAVPWIEELQEPHKSLCNVITGPHIAIEQQIQQDAHKHLSGSGVFKRGQSEIAVANNHVTPSSVIATMLTCDPGPVVVQYVSLQPRVGFTIHLSAPARQETSFNYVILTSEPS